MGQLVLIFPSPHRFLTVGRPAPSRRPRGWVLGLGRSLGVGVFLLPRCCTSLQLVCDICAVTACAPITRTLRGCQLCRARAVPESRLVVPKGERRPLSPSLQVFSCSPLETDRASIVNQSLLAREDARPDDVRFHKRAPLITRRVPESGVKRTNCNSAPTTGGSIVPPVRSAEAATPASLCPLPSLAPPAEVAVAVMTVWRSVAQPEAARSSLRSASPVLTFLFACV